MGVKLTFRKDFDCTGGAGENMADIVPYTTDGERIENVLVCMVEGGVGRVPTMTIKVHVTETLAENVAVRLKK